jgi:cytidine deaminase
MQNPMAAAQEKKDGPELVLGLIGPVGCDLDQLTNWLKNALSSVSYESRDVRLIGLVLEFEDWQNTPTSPFHERAHARMTAGNQFRQRTRLKDALALLAAAAIRDERKREHGEPMRPIQRCAYILRSLKTPEEVDALREIYGPNFVAVAAYMPRRDRRDRITKQIAFSVNEAESAQFEPDSAKLINRDEFEQDRYGQNIRETFPLADVFIDLTNPASAERETKRFIEILFGHPTHTPRRAENAMFHANGARLRSSSAGRQVGAAIVSSDGELLAVGTNEVARAHGGQYWSDEEDEYDYRDHRRTNDYNAKMLDAILKDLLARLSRMGWLSDSQGKESLDSLLRATKELLKPIPKEKRDDADPSTLGSKALLQQLIEYMRAVHAEMAALTASAKRGVGVHGCEMYVTTFPCHECARLIVASGIRRVFFIEPYPKSRVAEMYDDSIVVDGDGDENHLGFRAFVCVAPRRYEEFFEAPEPRGRSPLSEVIRRRDGEWINWDSVKHKRWPRRGDVPVAIMTRESSSLERFHKRLADCGLQS